MNRFDEQLAAHGQTLYRGELRTLQLNIGRKCNQACRHCHVDAAPWRTEMLDKTTARKIGQWIEKQTPEVVDITGGAPELSPHFRYLVETSRAANCHVIDRNNLTIIHEPDFEWLPGFLAQNQVEVIASLPCYDPENVTRQRGAGVYEKSISSLRQLNDLGYGKTLPLNLVYNPVGPTLPPSQSELEEDYRQSLLENHGITFSNLYVLTNQPIARFADDLRQQGKWDDYLELLANSFNPTAVETVMCRNTLSVDHQGRLAECDFNQMLGLHLGDGRPMRLWDINLKSLRQRPIRTGDHCLACTAGDGSSCTGALA